MMTLTLRKPVFFLSTVLPLSVALCLTLNLPALAAEPESTKTEKNTTEATKPEATKPEAAKPEAAKPTAPKTDTPKPEAPKPAAPKTDAPKPEASKPAAPKTDASKPEAPKTETPKAEAGKSSPPKAVTPKADTMHVELSKVTAEQFGQWMQGYYRAPMPDMVADMMRRGGELSLYEDQSMALLSGLFLSQLIKKHPDKALSWCQDMARAPMVNPNMVSWAYQQSGHKDWEQCVVKVMHVKPDYLVKLKELGKLDPLNEPVDTPLALDLLWTSFAATGNEVFVLKIISALGENPGVDEGVAALLRGAAAWSLVSFVITDPKVEKVVRAEEAKAKGITKTELTKVLAEAAKEMKR